MAKSLNVRFDGSNKIKKLLAQKEKALLVDLDNELDAFVLEVNLEQKKRTRVDTGFLVKGNNFRIDQPNRKELFNNIKYAPYVEFGTGGLVSVPKGLEDIAIQFKGAGIKQVNLPARPFFFAPFFEKKKDLMKRIINLLK